MMAYINQSIHIFVQIQWLIMSVGQVQYVQQPDPTGGFSQTSLIACFSVPPPSTTYTCNHLCTATMTGENALVLTSYCSINSNAFSVPIESTEVDSFRITASATNQYQMVYYQLNQPGLILVASCGATPCAPGSGISVFGRVYVPTVTDISSITNACNPCSAKTPVYTVTAVGQQGTITMHPGIALWSASVNNAQSPPVARAVFNLVPYDNVPVISDETVESYYGFNTNRPATSFYDTMDEVCRSNPTMSEELIPQFSQPTFLGQPRCLDPVTGGVTSGSCVFDPYIAFTGINNNQQFSIVSAGTVALCTCWAVTNSLSCSSPSAYVFDRLLTIAGPRGDQQWSVPVDTIFQLNIEGWGLGLKQANRDFLRIIAPGGSCTGTSASLYNPSGVTYIKSGCPNCSGGTSTVSSDIPTTSLRSADDANIPKISYFQFLPGKVILTFTSPIDSLLSTGDLIAIDPSTLLMGTAQRARASWTATDSAQAYQLSGQARFGDKVKVVTSANLDDYLFGHTVTLIDNLHVSIPVGLDDFKIVSVTPSLLNGGADWERHSSISTSFSLKSTTVSANNIVCWGRINANSGLLEYYASAGTISFTGPPSFSVIGMSLTTSLAQIAQPFVVFFSPNNVRSNLYSQAAVGGTLEIRLTFLNLAKLTPVVVGESGKIAPTLLPANYADVADSTICGLLFGQLVLRDDIFGFPIPNKCMYTSIWTDNGINQRRIHLFFSPSENGWNGIRTSCSGPCYYEIELMGYLGSSASLSDPLIRVETACPDCISTNPYYVIESGTASMSPISATPYTGFVNDPAIGFAVIDPANIDSVTGAATLASSRPSVSWTNTQSQFFFGFVPNVGSTIVSNSKLRIVLGPSLVWNMPSDAACVVSVPGTSPSLGAGLPASAYACVVISLPGTLARYRVIEYTVPFTIPPSSSAFTSSAGTSVTFPIVFRITISSSTSVFRPSSGFDATKISAIYWSLSSDPTSVKSLVSSLNSVAMQSAQNAPSSARSRVLVSGRTGDGVLPFTGQYGNIVRIRIQPIRTMLGGSSITFTLPAGYFVDIRRSLAFPTGGTWSLPLKYTLVSSMMISAYSWAEFSLFVSNPRIPISRSDALWYIQIGSSSSPSLVGSYLPTTASGFLPGGPAVLSPLAYATIQPMTSTLVSSVTGGTATQFVAVFFRSSLGMVPNDLIIISPPTGVTFASPSSIALLPEEYYYKSEDPANDLLPLQITDIEISTLSLPLFPPSSAIVRVNRFIDPTNIVGFKISINNPSAVPTVPDWFLYLADSVGSPKEGSPYPVEFDGYMDNIMDRGSFQFTRYSANAQSSNANPSLAIAAIVPTSRLGLPTTLTISSITVGGSNLSNATLSVQLPTGFKFVKNPSFFSFSPTSSSSSPVTPTYLGAAEIAVPYLTLTTGSSYSLSNPITVPDYVARYSLYVVIVRILNNGIANYATSYVSMPPVSSVINSRLDCSDKLVSSSQNKLRFTFQPTTELVNGDVIDIIGDSSTNLYSYPRFLQPTMGTEAMLSNTEFSMKYPPKTGNPFHAQLKVVNGGPIPPGIDYQLVIEVINPDVTTASLGAGPQGPQWSIGTSRDFPQKFFACPVMNQLPPISFGTNVNRDDRPLRPNIITFVSAFDTSNLPSLVSGTVTYPPQYMVYEDCLLSLLIDGMTINSCRASLVDDLFSPGFLSFTATRSLSSSVGPVPLKVTLSVYRNPPFQPPTSLDIWSLTLNNAYASQSLIGFQLDQFEYVYISPTFYQVSKSLGFANADTTSFPVTFMFRPRTTLPITNTGPLSIRRDSLGLNFGVLNYTANSGMYITAPSGYVFDSSLRSTTYNDFRDTTTPGNSMFSLSSEIYFNKTNNLLTIVFIGGRSLLADHQYTLTLQMIAPQIIPPINSPDPTWFVQSFVPNMDIADELTVIADNNYLAARMNFFNVTVVGFVPLVSTVLNSNFFNRAVLNTVQVRMVLNFGYNPTNNGYISINAPSGFILANTTTPGACLGVTLPALHSALVATCADGLNTLKLSGGNTTIAAGSNFIFTLKAMNPNGMTADVTSQLYWRAFNYAGAGALYPDTEASQFQTWRVFTLMPSNMQSPPILSISGSRFGSSSFTNITLSITAALMEANFVHLSVDYPSGFNFSRAECQPYDIYRALTTSCWNCIGIGGVVLLPGVPVALNIRNVQLGLTGDQSSFTVKTFYIPPALTLVNPFTNSSTYREEYISTRNANMFISGISAYKNSSLISNYQPPNYVHWSYQFPLNPRIGYAAYATITFDTTISPYSLPFPQGFSNITYVNATFQIDCGLGYKIAPNWDQYSVKPDIGNLSAVPLIINKGHGLTASYDSAVYLLDPQIYPNWTITVPVYPLTNSSASLWLINLYANGTLFTTTDKLFGLPQNTSYAPVNGTNDWTSLEVIFPVRPLLPRPNTAISLRFNVTQAPPRNIANITLIAPASYVVLSVLTPCQLNANACGYMWTDRDSQNRIFFLPPLQSSFDKVENFYVDFTVLVPTEPADALDEWYVVAFTDTTITGQLVSRWGEIPGLNVDFSSISRVLYGSMSAVYNQQFLLLFTVREGGMIDSMEIIPPAGLILTCDTANPVDFLDCTSSSSLTHGLLLNRTSDGQLDTGDYVMPILVSVPLSTPNPNSFDIIMRDPTGIVIDGVYGLAGRPVTDSSLVSVIDASIKMNTTQVGEVALITLSFKTLQSTTSVDAITIVFPTYYYHQIESQTEVSCVNRKFPRSPFQWVDLSSTQSLTFLVDDTVTNLVEISTGQAIVLNRVPGNQTFVFEFPVVLPYATPEKLNFWILSFCKDRNRIEDCLDWHKDDALAHVPIVGSQLSGASDTSTSGNSNTMFREGLCSEGITNEFYNP